jgi:flagellar protein FlaG
LNTKEDKMIEDIVKTDNFNSASTVEIRRGSNDEPKVKETEKKAASENARSDSKSVKEAMDTISQVAKIHNSNIQIEFETDTNIMIVKVIDGDTGEVIRQIPPDELIALSRHAKNQKGLLIHKEG